MNTSKFRLTVTLFTALLLSFSAARIYAQQPPMPEPQKEHKWLEQFLGDWDTEAEIVIAPGQAPIKSKGVDKARKVGGFWVVSEGSGEVMGMAFASVFTVGYDPEKKKYIGTWIDSMQNMMWKYEGTVDATGKILTLETEGPNAMKPGQICKFRDVTEFKSKDERVFTSSMLDDGKWVTFVTVKFTRKK